jgi:hypothetical protein
MVHTIGASVYAAYRTDAPPRGCVTIAISVQRPGLRRVREAAVVTPPQ